MCKKDSFLKTCIIKVKREMKQNFSNLLDNLMMKLIQVQKAFETLIIQNNY